MTIASALLHTKRRVLTSAQSNLPDGLLVAGWAGISYGAWLAYAPAGYIVGGLLLLVAGVLASRTSS